MRLGELLNVPEPQQCAQAEERARSSGLAGESPGKRGRKFKTRAELLEAVSLRLSISQANGAEQGGREILQTLKAATTPKSRGRSSVAGS